METQNDCAFGKCNWQPFCRIVRIIFEVKRWKTLEATFLFQISFQSISFETHFFSPLSKIFNFSTRKIRLAGKERFYFMQTFSNISYSPIFINSETERWKQIDFWFSWIRLCSMKFYPFKILFSNPGHLDWSTSWHSMAVIWVFIHLIH